MLVFSHLGMRITANHTLREQFVRPSICISPAPSKGRKMAAMLLMSVGAITAGEHPVEPLGSTS